MMQLTRAACYWIFEALPSCHQILNAPRLPLPSTALFAHLKTPMTTPPTCPLFMCDDQTRSHGEHARRQRITAEQACHAPFTLQSVNGTNPGKKELPVKPFETSVDCFLYSVLPLEEQVECRTCGRSLEFFVFVLRLFSLFSCWGVAYLRFVHEAFNPLLVRMPVMHILFCILVSKSRWFA